jgi:two-component system, NtrC family, nitrogen regulation sensor histidine kinase NtrY
MAHAVTKDLQQRFDAFDEFMQEPGFAGRLFSNAVTEKESDRFIKFPFYIFGYEGDTLKFWNTNITVAARNDSAVGKTLILHNEKGVFIARYATLGAGRQIVALFPIVITYPLENNYLKSHFAASDYIPLKTKIIDPAGNPAGAYPITVDENKTLFFLRFNPQEIQRWVPDTAFILSLVLAIAATMFWIQLMVIYLMRNKSGVAGFVVTLVIISAFRILLYTYGLPFNLDTLTFFSPSLYGSSKYLSSFGDLFINTLCILWLVIFITRHTNYKTYCQRFQKNTIRAIVAGVLVFALAAYVFLFVNVIRSLVLDSAISFDVSHFYSINSYTILGLLVIGTIMGISCLIIYVLNIQLQVLINNHWLKYLLVLVAGITFLIITGNTPDLFNIAILLWLLLFLALLDIPKLAFVSDLFEPRMIFWAVFICAFCTVILQYFNEVKEHEARTVFVDLRLSPHRDNVMESVFEKSIDNIQLDKGLKSFFYRPSAAARKVLNQRFDAQYLSGPVNKYHTKVYLFDKNKNGLFNKDSTSYNTLLEEEKEISPVNHSTNLFYKESVPEGHFYLSYIPVIADTINEKIGYVIIELELKKQVAETVYPELLQTGTNKASSEENEYAYAVYINDKLITQTKDYAFATYLKNDTLKEQKFAFYTTGNISELHYKIADRRTIVVVNRQSQIIGAITLFSYLFGMQVLLAIIILLYQLYISYFANVQSDRKFIRLTLRKRVHFSMLAVVLISFVIIGSVTVFFFTNQYQASNKDKFQTAMQAAKQSVQDYYKNENAYDSYHVFDTVSRSAKFKDYVTTVAKGQKIDINIFDGKGELLASSQDDIYNKGLISRRMRPDAYYELNVFGRSIVIQNERVGGLSYLSAYEALRDEKGATLGYINVPFFSSEKDLNFQISNIVVTLINLYAFIFLLSSMIAIFITRWITRTFNMIIGQFSRINLRRNERISWPYDDEIGLLVSEYNKMVNKVEENAALLAQSERESAWREMARQVAHEIKNPLTPMKLNIQYLQQAMRNGNPDIKELTNKVSDSIIEQIDNLSYIASEFSNFAKMPEARPEELELNDLLHRAVELYMNESRIKVTIQPGSEKLFVFSDRSQLLRVFTNLLENAKQAIPEDQAGSIEVAIRHDGNDAVISIADNGEGISDEVAAKIFQPYFTTKSSGTGLGLAMTRKILEFWKGEIWFESLQEKGTTFYIRLPLVRAGAPAPQQN